MERWSGDSRRWEHDAQAVPVLVRRRVASWSAGVAQLAIVGLLVAACSSSSVAGATGTPVVVATPVVTPAPVATPAPTDTSAAAPVPSLPDATGVPTSIDPCQLVTASEASALAGATFGAGVESTTEGNGKICTYGGQTLNVFMVIVGQEPDVATAQAGKAAAQAAIAKEAGKGITFTELPTFADGAALAVIKESISGVTFYGSAFYALKGTVFFGFSDLARTPTPDAAAMQAQATTILTRLP
jgi:hypothetical protein